MKKLFNRCRNTARRIKRIFWQRAVKQKAEAAKYALANNRAEGYVDTAVKILMAVVIGALVLAGLYALFGDTVMPELTRRIQEMFNYNG